MNITLQIGNDGIIILPSELREKYGIKSGDVIRLVDLEGVFILTPMTPIVPELARAIEQFRLEAGISTEEMLEGLREQRERYFQEKYGNKPSA
jgi:bifunctional DNA-binding transcriptional regulator/antitoxin component of YhaV-PrlF toxin-antitoxin module